MTLPVAYLKLIPAGAYCIKLSFQIQLLVLSYNFNKNMQIVLLTITNVNPIMILKIIN